VALIVVRLSSASVLSSAVRIFKLACSASSLNLHECEMREEEEEEEEEREGVDGHH
jgi:hypothetical protein